MAIYKVQGPDGAIHRFEGPDDATPEQVTAAAQAQFGQTPTPSAPKPIPEEKPKSGIETLLDPLMMKIGKFAIDKFGNEKLDKARGVAMGAADPVVGAVQLGANLVGQGEGINKRVADVEQQYEQTRKLRGDEGIDLPRLTGAVVSPTNALGAGWLAKAKTIGQLATRGAAMGGLMGAAQPVAEPEDYWDKKAGQTVTGAAGGAVLTPVASKLVGALASTINSTVQKFRAPTAEAASQQAQKIMQDWSQQASGSGIDFNNLGQEVTAAVQARIADALRSGKQVKPDEILRAADFEALGMQGTRGQITRDPMQFAQERNLRGVDTGGGKNALADRFAQQGQKLRAPFREGEAAPDAYNAGSRLIQALQESDKPVKAGVDAAYSAARDETGRYAGLDVATFSKRANDALDEGQLGRFLPDNVKGLLNDVSAGKVPLNVNTAAQIDSVLSTAQRTADRAAALAIGKVRDALNSAPIESQAGQQAKAAFDKARAAAKDRFAKIEGSPALKAALDDADPDQFVKKFVTGAKTAKELKNLADTLPEDAKGVARSQIMKHLRDAAFGADTAGDSAISPERFNKALSAMGKDKLLAFFTPDEVGQLQAAGRVMSYIKTQPEGSAVNNSNTGSAVANLVSNVLSRPGLNVARNSVRGYQNERAIKEALSQPQSGAAISPQVMRLIEALRASGGMVGGAAGGSLAGEVGK